MTDLATAAPDTLPSLPPWLAAGWQQLCWALAADRVGHGVLMHGPAGIGKNLLAQHYAARLLCVQATGEAPACGECAGCRLRLAGNHPDQIRIGIPDDKQAIGIEQIRELSNHLQQSAHRSGWRAVIIEPAEAMTLPAANALLKTLEEPGAKVVMILVVHQLERLPATIRSRCLRLPLAIPETAAALAWLRTALPTLEPARLQQALAVASGAPLRVAALVAGGALEQIEALEKGLLSVARGELAPGQLAAGQADVPLALQQLQRIVIRGLQKSLSGDSRLPATVWDCFAAAVLEALRALRVNPALQATTLLESVLIQWFDFTEAMRHSTSAASKR